MSFFFLEPFGLYIDYLEKIDEIKQVFLDHTIVQGKRKLRQTLDELEVEYERSRIFIGMMDTRFKMSVEVPRLTKEEFAEWLKKGIIVDQNGEKWNFSRFWSYAKFDEFEFETKKTDHTSFDRFVYRS
jgi:NADH:ubiquinone oxidoreductase subunit D